MNNTAKERYESIEDYEENCYLFSQSISRQRTVSGKTYYVRSYFKGGKDFEQAVTKLVTRQASDKIAG